MSCCRRRSTWSPGPLTPPSPLAGGIVAVVSPNLRQTLVRPADIGALQLDQQLEQNLFGFQIRARGLADQAGEDGLRLRHPRTVGVWQPGAPRQRFGEQIDEAPGGAGAAAR